MESPNQPEHHLIVALHSFGALCNNTCRTTSPNGIEVCMNTERIETPAERALREFQSEVRGMPVEERDLLKIEGRIQELLNARGCEILGEVMREADTDAPEVEIAGERWGNRRIGRGEYQTTFGPVVFERSFYQRGGRGRVAVPLELRLGLVEGTYTPKMARVLSLTTAMMTDEDGEAFLAEVGTARASKSTIHRVPRAMAARHEINRTVIEKAVRGQDKIPQEATTMQVALDGVMVPQDGEHAKPRGRKTKSPDPPRHEQRYGLVASPGPANDDGHEGRAWHEASVGTVAFFDAEGRRLKTIYLARMPEPLKATLVQSLNDEVEAVLGERADLNVVFASDGAAPHWTAVKPIADRVALHSTGHTMFLVDAYHVAEYVQKAANAVTGQDTAEAKVLAATWRETLKETEGGARTVLRSMRARLVSVENASQRKDLEEAIAYIDNQNNLGRMKYAEAQRRNYPIGTGITEAAAKTVVGTRMKRSGARFSQHGGQTVMLFRTAVLSGRFDALHRELGASYTKPLNIAA